MAKVFAAATLLMAAGLSPAPVAADDTPPLDMTAGIASIGGCAAVHCPNPIEDSTENVCMLQDRTFSDIGIRRFGGGPIGETELAWVQGSSGSDDGEDVLVSSAFYLGTPFEYDAGDVRACAAFFHGTSGNVTAGPESGDDEADDNSRSGSCEQMGVPRSCTDALASRARSLEVGEDEDACAMLEDDLRENLDRACAGVAGGDRWEDLQVRPILGRGAPAPILSSDNLTSNCWPITPKEHDLAFIDSHEETARDIYGVTPILTVFYDWGGDATGPRISTAMSCLKAVNSSVEAEEERREREDDDDDDDDNAAVRIHTSAAAAAVVVLLTMLGHLVF